MVEGYFLGKVKWFYKGRWIVWDDWIIFFVYNILFNVVIYFMVIWFLEFGDFGIYICKVFNNVGSVEV